MIVSALLIVLVLIDVYAVYLGWRILSDRRKGESGSDYYGGGYFF